VELGLPRCDTRVELTPPVETNGVRTDVTGSGNWVAHRRHLAGSTGVLKFTF